MKSTLVYLLQVIIASGILYSYYHFFLRNKKFHGYNRYYLLAATLISISVPFLKIPVYFNSYSDFPVIYKVLAEVKISNSKVTATPNSLSWQMILSAFYISVTLIAFTKLIVSLIRIFKIIHRNKAIKIDNFLLVSTKAQGTPFSFCNWLFWDNTISIDSEKGRQILQHEIFHIRQKHSIDVIYLECLSALFWINPFFIRIKKEIKAIHEFSADEFAMKTSNKLEYAELLLQCAFQTNQQFVNPFFHNQIKRRIAMITNSSKPSHQYLRKAMVLPVVFVALAIVAVNCKAKDTYQEIDQQKEAKNPVSLADKKESVTAIASDKVYEKVEVEPSFPNGDAGWRKFLEKNINASVPVDNQAPSGSYMCWVQFIVDNEGHISDIKPLTNHGYGMEQEVIRIMKLSPNWVPGSDNGIAVKAYRKQPVTFVITEE